MLKLIQHNQHAHQIGRSESTYRICQDDMHSGYVVHRNIQNKNEVMLDENSERDLSKNLNETIKGPALCLWNADRDYKLVDLVMLI